MSNVKKLLNLNLARFRLKTATLGLRTTAVGRKFQFSLLIETINTITLKNYFKNYTHDSDMHAIYSVFNWTNIRANWRS